jgi:truncated hemoglobin YjbI
MEGLEVLSATAIYDYTHGRRRMERRHLPSGIYRTTRRTLATMADRVGRARTRGRSWLWRLRDPE